MIWPMGVFVASLLVWKTGLEKKQGRWRGEDAMQSAGKFGGRPLQYSGMVYGVVSIEPMGAAQLVYSIAVLHGVENDRFHIGSGELIKVVEPKITIGLSRRWASNGGGKNKAIEGAGSAACCR
eukprot:GFKZ01007637.1.p5 GENE.GFKZ01007637.1~~GFKZ01007637.1.p5  ORF type:complete len:123 (+),score=16.35 GFKZ01007637.1:1502-1870(+)